MKFYMYFTNYPYQCSGFMPPEYIDSGFISKKFDVFSLGVIIIKMLAGDKSYFRCSEMPSEQFIELVTEIWTKKLQAKPGYSSHEIDMLGVTSCVEIALRCVDRDRNKRPCINDIVHELDQLEAKLKEMSLASDVSNDATVQVRSSTTGGPWVPLLCFFSILESSVLTVLTCQIYVC
uniref:Protein kinase domain-containing protein n=1 Tax=Aegilops tauschii subsp. strangulata TaxID=200361 RepID=A0A453A9J8_AEGTS